MLIAIGALVLLIGIPLGLWAAGVAFSGPHGRGEQIKQINDANNRTFAQEQFVQLLADVKSYTAQVHVQRDALAATPASDTAETSRLRQVLAGLQNQCLATRNQYDAAAQKISTRQFQEHSLPATISDYQPQEEVSCK